MTIRKNFTLPITVVTAALLFTGCGDRDSLDDLALGTSRQQPAPTKKAADIFDEFYMDDAPRAQAPAELAAAAAPAQPSRPVPPPSQPQRTTPAQPARTQTPPRGSGAYSFNPSGRYVVQVNVTASQADANRQTDRLKGMGFPAYIAEVQNPSADLIGTYYRVRIGGFDSREVARNFGESALVPAGFQYWIDRRANDRVGAVAAAQPAPAQPAPQAAPAQAAKAAPQQTAPAAAAQPAAQPAARPAARPAAQPAVEDDSNWGNDEW